MNNDSVGKRIPKTMHGCSKSVITQVCIPGTNLVFCVENVSCIDGKITVKTSIESLEKRIGKKSEESIIQECVILEDCYTLDVRHLIPGGTIICSHTNK